MSGDLPADVLDEAIRGTLPDGHVLTAWCVVAATVGPDGLHMTRRVSHVGAADWQWKGLLHDALHGDGWEYTDDDGDGGDGS